MTPDFDTAPAASCLSCFLPWNQLVWFLAVLELDRRRLCGSGTFLQCAATEFFVATCEIGVV